MNPLHVLIVDDNFADAELTARQIARGGFPCTWRRVETEHDLRTQLREFHPQLIISDFTLPQYDGLSALALASTEAPSIPFIFVSGTIGEQRALEALNRGASDYVCKSDLTRLLPAVTRVLAEPRDSPSPPEHIQPVAAALEMLSDVRAPSPLTGLPKRECFTEYLDHRLRQATDQSPTTVIVFDVQRLRDVNAAHGRHVGDRLLQHLAERLRQRFVTRNELAHFGGGTFAAVFADHRIRPNTPPGPLVAIFKHSLALGHHPLQVAVNCGLARYPAHGHDAETILQNAEGALRRLRERRDAPPYALIGARAIDTRQHMLEQRVRLAARQQSFSLNYQPVVERVSGQVIAVEALLRWDDAELGLVPPAIFLPVLEQTGLMVPVGEWVLAQAVRDFEHWHALGLPPVRVAINISPVEFNRNEFIAEFLHKTRRASGPAHIDIEISEQALHHNLEHLRHTLRTLRGEGVRVAIDDFAMTHTALSHLSELPVDSLKIDRCFVNDLTQLPESQAIVSSIIALARTYGLRTVAEGVESIEQLRILDSLGCEQSQGYLHSPAVSAEQIERIIAVRSRPRGNLLSS